MQSWHVELYQERKLCPRKLQGGICEGHSLAWQALIYSTRSCGQYFTDHSWIRCRVGLSFILWLFCSFPALQREVGLCSCGVHVLPSIPLVVVTVGVTLCWKSPHSRAVKLCKYPFINDSLACICTLVQSGVSWACQCFSEEQALIIQWSQPTQRTIM